jgi:hypothetical protein
VYSGYWFNLVRRVVAWWAVSVVTYRENMKKYKKKCEYCGKLYKGSARRKYCKAGCRTMANKKANNFDSVAALREMLLLEMEYFKGDSMEEYVELCGYVWRRYNLKRL